MSAVSAPAPYTQQRPTALVAAIVLTVVTSILSIATVGMIPDEAPAFIAPLSIATGVLGIAASYFVWRGAKWAAWLIIVMNALNALAAAPAPFAAPDAASKTLGTIGLVTSVAICVLLLKRSSRSALS